MRNKIFVLGAILHNYIFASDIPLLNHKQINQFENGLRNPLLVEGESSQYHNILEEMRRYNVPGVSIVIIHDGKIYKPLNYGYAKNKDKVTDNTMFEAGSISKVFTTIGILKLYQESFILLNDNVNNYLKSWKIQDSKYTRYNKVTAAELMSHTGGINVAGFAGLDRNIKPLPSTIDILNGRKPVITTPKVEVVATPGKQFSYSGGGMTILQLLIEDMTNESYAQWMSTNIFNPLQMAQSSFEQPLPDVYVNFAACGHDEKGVELKACWHNYPELGAAGLWTTSSDLSKLLLALIEAYYHQPNNLPLKDKVSSQIFIEHENYGVGFGIGIQTESNLVKLNHDGSVDGYKSSMTAFVSKLGDKNDLKEGIIILTNGENGWNLYPEVLASFTDTFKIATNQPIHIKPIKLINQQKYTGKYKLLSNIDSWSFNIINQNKELYCDYGHGLNAKLYFINSNEAYTLDGSYFRFTTNIKTGKINQLEIQQYQDKGISKYKHS